MLSRLLSPQIRNSIAGLCFSKAAGWTVDALLSLRVRQDLLHLRLQPPPIATNLDASTDLDELYADPRGTMQRYRNVRADKLKAKIRNWENNPQNVWWYKHSALLRVVPHRVALLPLRSRIWIEAQLDSWEANHPRCVYGGYLTIGTITRLALVWFSSDLIANSIQTFLTVAPKQLTKRISVIAGWATGGIGLTAVATHTLWLEVAGELVDITDTKRTGLNQTIRSISYYLFEVIRKLPTLLGDLSLGLALLKLGWPGRGYAAIRIGYRAVTTAIWAKRRWNNESEHKTYTDAELDDPEIWQQLRILEVGLELKAADEWEPFLNELEALQVQPTLASHLFQHELRKVTDRYSILAIWHTPEGASCQSHIDRLSPAAKAMFRHLNPINLTIPGYDYEKMRNQPELWAEWLVELEKAQAADAALLADSILANPAQKYRYERLRGDQSAGYGSKAYHHLSATNTAPSMLFSVWMTREDFFPWGEPGDISPVDEAAESRVGSPTDYKVFDRAVIAIAQTE